MNQILRYANRILILLVLLLSSCELFQGDTGVTDTHIFLSSSISAVSTVLIYYPEDYSPTIPVIYLLNGGGTDAYAWGSGMDLAQEAYDRNLMFVSLSAGDNPYSNSLNNSNEQYDDYVLEVVSKVEKEYDVEIGYEQRALCGISNGGGGAIYLLSVHPDTFIACGSLSGSVYSTLIDYENFEGTSVRIDIGTEDDNLSPLRWLRDRLNGTEVQLEYFEHAGDHDWKFWRKWAPRQFDFLEDIIS